MSETTDAAQPTEGTEAADIDTLAAKAAWMLDNGATNESRDLCEGVLALRARLTGEAQGRDLVEIAATHGKTLNLRIYPYHRVYAWWGVEDGDEDSATEGNGNDALSIALRALRAAPPTAKAEAPFKLPVMVVALAMPDAWAVYDAAGNLVAETYERERADFIAAAINAYAPTAKAPSGPLPAVAIGQNATGTNGPPSGTMFDPAIGGGQSAGVPTPDEPEGEATDDA